MVVFGAGLRTAAFFDAAPIFGAVLDVVAFATGLEATTAVLDFLDFGSSLPSSLSSSDAFRFVTAGLVAVVEALGFVPLRCVGVALDLAAEALDFVALGTAVSVTVNFGCVVVIFDFFVLGCSASSSAEALRFVALGLAAVDVAGGATVDGFRDEARETFAG
jgi:hypothetical protein